MYSGKVVFCLSLTPSTQVHNLDSDATPESRMSEYIYQGIKYIFNRGSWKKTALRRDAGGKGWKKDKNNYFKAKKITAAETTLAGHGKH